MHIGDRLETLLNRYPVLGPLYGAGCIVLGFLALLALGWALEVAAPTPDAAPSELGSYHRNMCHINGCRG